MDKKRRLRFILFVMVCISAAAGLSLYSLREAVSYFYTPSEVKAMREANSAVVAPSHDFRLGGLVVKGSLTRPDEQMQVRFRVTDLKDEQRVQYQGILPDLFREGQGVVAKGHLDDSGTFIARELLAKHDEKYMPPEVAKGLKKVHDDMKGKAP
ncbi:MAG: cytochrome c maturation protein CcmE [Alphaproteobacteria bacterium]